ncbi:MAG: hypothetical protein EOO45_15880 [Flavobacterium sp.]|nr:MAG: hypothetical protein EOO45_15880 [Flavobacterium sp.]
MLRHGTIQSIDSVSKIGVIVDANLQDIEFILPDEPKFHPGMKVVFVITYSPSGGLIASEVTKDEA